MNVDGSCNGLVGMVYSHQASECGVRLSAWWPLGCWLSSTSGCGGHGRAWQVDGPDYGLAWLWVITTWRWSSIQLSTSSIRILITPPTQILLGSHRTTLARNVQPEPTLDPTSTTAITTRPSHLATVRADQHLTSIPVLDNATPWRVGSRHPLLQATRALYRSTNRSRGASLHRSGMDTDSLGRIRLL